jgi:hypothetical protein
MAPLLPPQVGEVVFAENFLNCSAHSLFLNPSKTSLNITLCL